MGRKRIHSIHSVPWLNLFCFMLITPIYSSIHFQPDENIYKPKLTWCPSWPISGVGASECRSVWVLASAPERSHSRWDPWWAVHYWHC